MSAVAAGAETQAVRIVITDEHPIFRDGLRRLLETRPGHSIVGEASDEPTTVALVRDLVPDLLLVGASSAERWSPETLRQIGALDRAIPTILLTRSAARAGVTSALGFGAYAVVLMESGPDVLFESIRRATTARDRIEILSPRADGPPSPFGLTPRELQILAAVVQGHTNKAIALRCSISENTVKRHLMHIFDKVGASNRVELALFADHHELTRAV